MENKEKLSYFDGKTIQLIGWRLLQYLLTAVTFGIAFPWAMCMTMRWEKKHTVINGRRLKFTGNGGQLFGKYILWCFLTVITFGIYSIWFGLGMEKWKAKHTVFADDNTKTESKFTGGAGGWFGRHLLYGIHVIFTLGIGTAWAQKNLVKWKINHTVISGNELKFHGTGGQLFVKYLLLGIFSVLTVGVYALFFPVKYLKWEASKTESMNNNPAVQGENGEVLPTEEASEKEKKPMKKGRKVLVGILCGIGGAILITALIFAGTFIHAVDHPGTEFMGYKVFVLRSDSMNPSLSAGDVIYVSYTEPSELAVGDIITFVYEAEYVATHRIADIEIAEDGSYWFYTKGDMNTEMDANPVSASEIFGKYEKKTTFIGKLLGNIKVAIIGE